ncbi:uncharacterized protein LOC142339311 isoform X2 [Convolutriloba macropyga]|uniref:uncharacterized protein LOC142339311 isoform X2 n=1 Tax=Convolutriloba macropyga TaxID=536237 RepID=UPI003F51F09D
MSDDDDLDLLLLETGGSPAVENGFPKIPMKHGLVLNVGPHRQQWYGGVSGSNNNDVSTNSGPETAFSPSSGADGEIVPGADGRRGNEQEVDGCTQSPTVSSNPHASSSSSGHHLYINASEDAMKTLLTSIYDRGYQLSGLNRDSVDSDTTFTGYSSTCEMRNSSMHASLASSGTSSAGVVSLGACTSGGIASPKLLLNCDSLAQKQSEKSQRSYMSDKSVLELRAMIAELQHRVSQTSSRLVRLLKKKDKQLERQHSYCDVITASLQASSLKRRVDTRIKFSILPQSGRRAFRQWHDALRAMCRLPSGIPRQLRKKVWLCLADNYLRHLKIDWEKTVRYTFNDRSNPDDEKLGIQIVKDLHRTGYSGFSSGEGAEAGRALLKRVLLAYARWNKQVGYCQGFNVLAATLLQVCEGNEGDALKLMIYLIDRVLPQNYFSHNLRALSVDMAVFRDLLREQQPLLSAHFDKLQSLANSVAPFSSSQSSGSPSPTASTANYEPPLTNVFTMQWFLTLFATCLPKQTVLRVWDAIFLEGSEMLLRVALTLWDKISPRILQVESADEFYCLMANIQLEMFEYDLIDCENLIQTVYSMGPSPLANLSELREKYTYNITPFSPMHQQANSGANGSSGSKSMSGSKSLSASAASALSGSSSSDKLGRVQSDDEDDIDDRSGLLKCFPAPFLLPSGNSSPQKNGSNSGSKDIFSGDESSGSGTGINQTGLGCQERSSSSGGSPGGGLSGGPNSDQLKYASPGAYSSPLDPRLPSVAPLERMSTDIHALKKQYSKLQQRMQQVHVIYYDKTTPHGGRSSADPSIGSNGGGNSSGNSANSSGSALNPSPNKPVEVVNCMKTNLAINHLFIVNKDHAKTQLALTPSTGIDPNQPVNHLTIKPYIPADPLNSSPSPTRSNSYSPTEDDRYSHTVSQLSSRSTDSSPLKLTNQRRATVDAAVHDIGLDRSESVGMQPHQSQFRAHSSSPTNDADDLISIASDLKHPTMDSLSLEDAYHTEDTTNEHAIDQPNRRKKSLENSPRSHASNSGRAGTPSSPLMSHHSALESSGCTTEDENVSHQSINVSPRRTSQQSTPNFPAKSVEQFDFEEPKATKPTTVSKIPRQSDLKQSVIKPICSRQNEHQQQRRFSTGAKPVSASQMYRKPPLKPNIRPNLGMNDRPRIYNPFPVNYVHNSKLKKGKSLGMYPNAKSSSDNNSLDRSSATSGGSKPTYQNWK